MTQTSVDGLIREIIALKERDQELLLHLHKPGAAGTPRWSARLGHASKWEFTNEGEDLPSVLTNLLNSLRESITP